MRRFIPGDGDLSKGRFEAFSDGVFAIAITLLVLEIHVPELHLPASNDEMAAAIGKLGGPLLTYVISFGTIGIVWLNHTATFEHIRSVDRMTNLLNLILLGVVCFLPFPTALVARYGPLPASTVLYGATFELMSLAYGALWWYASKREERLDPEAPRLTLAIFARGQIGTSAFLIGTLLAFIAPQVSVTLFALTTLFYLLPGLFRPKGARARRAASRGDA